MKYEVIAYYQNTPNANCRVDKELSVPVREVAEDEAARYMAIFEAVGHKRRENAKQIWYTYVADRTHHTEYIFWKE